MCRPFVQNYYSKNISYHLQREQTNFEKNHLCDYFVIIYNVHFPIKLYLHVLF